MNRIICTPSGSDFAEPQPGDLGVVLYGHPPKSGMAAIGAAVQREIARRGLAPAPRAWDLLSIALSVIAADVSVSRDRSPDGWTRRMDLSIAVADPGFWNTQSALLSQLLRFLTTDIWDVTFVPDGLRLSPPDNPNRPDQDCVVLLSGGLDSLVGMIDLVKAHGRNPHPVSQVSPGDKQKQVLFASAVGAVSPLQLNHTAKAPGRSERSQRARSIVFFAYGVLMATALQSYHEGKPVELYVCENGFISVNPPLTASRVGSLSTRTTHPFLMKLFQQLLGEADLHVLLRNPYQFRTKGEMLQTCGDQSLLRTYAHLSTSCGRYARHGYSHCGRCVPCLIRRAAFHAWGVDDESGYVYADLSRDDDDHARYDDVRCASMAIESAREQGLLRWAGQALSTALLGGIGSHIDVVGRGLRELASFLRSQGVV